MYHNAVRNSINVIIYKKYICTICMLYILYIHFKLFICIPSFITKKSLLFLC